MNHIANESYGDLTGFYFICFLYVVLWHRSNIRNLIFFLSINIFFIFCEWTRILMIAINSSDIVLIFEQIVLNLMLYKNAVLLHTTLVFSPILISYFTTKFMSDTMASVNCEKIEIANNIPIQCLNTVDKNRRKQYIKNLEYQIKNKDLLTEDEIRWKKIMIIRSIGLLSIAYWPYTINAIIKTGLT